MNRPGSRNPRILPSATVAVRRSRLAIPAIAAAFVAGGLGAAAQQGPHAPAGLEIDVREHRLDNGLLLLLAPRPNSGIVEAGWVVRAGSIHETAGESGAAHLVEHMMFKGSRTISARDWEREHPLLEEEDALQLQLGELTAEAESAAADGRRWRRLQGRLDELQGRLADLARSLRELVWLGEFSFRYSEAGATGLNANTAADYTVYYVTLPAEALETWFWLETDRLREPVFREIYKEREVVREERRLRVLSTPTGRLEEAVEIAYWGTNGYGRPTLGRPEDVASLSRRQVHDFFERAYAPARVTAALVGDFDPKHAVALAERYFGRLTGGTTPLEPDLAPLPAAPRTWDGTCPCPTQVRIRYPTVALAHQDTPALQMLAGILNGRAGRLYRSLVLDQELAFAAATEQRPLAHAGLFEVAIEAKGGVTPEALVVAWDREVARLLAAPPDASEIGRTANALVAGSLRQLREPSQLLRRLLAYDALDTWRGLAAWPRTIQAVDGDAVAEVARLYLRPDRRWLGRIRRAEGDG